MAPGPLFSKFDAFEVIESQKARLVRAYEKLSDDDALDETVIKQLKAKYMLDVPTLRPAGEMWAEQGKAMIDVRGAHNRVFLDDSNPIMEEVTELTVHVPFDGDPGVFNIAPTAYNSRIAFGEILGNELLLRFQIISANFDAQAHIDRELTQVNWALNYLREQTVVFDQELESALRQAVTARKRRIDTRIDVIGKLNIPIRTSPPNTPARVAQPIAPAQPKPEPQSPVLKPTTWDVFICHASEDKDYVDELHGAFVSAGITVWVDNSVLLWGNRLRKKIDDGLKKSRYAVVVLSKAFLAEKKWTEYELDSAFALETAQKERILPLTHGITQDELREYSPALSYRIALDSQKHSFTEITNNMSILLGIRHEGAIPIAEAKTAAPQELPVAEDIKKGETVAYAWYWARGGSLKGLYVRKSAKDDHRFTLEEPDGTIHEGLLDDIANKYQMVDRKLRNSGLRPSSIMGSGQFPQLNLP